MPLNQGVLGSNPCWPTRNECRKPLLNKGLRFFYAFFSRSKKRANDRDLSQSIGDYFVKAMNRIRPWKRIKASKWKSLHPWRLKRTCSTQSAVHHTSECKWEKGFVQLIKLMYHFEGFCATMNSEDLEN